MSENRGEFGFTRGRGPRVTRKVAGRLEEVYLREAFDVAAPDDLTVGMSPDDARGGRANGFGEFARKQAAAGSGDPAGDVYDNRGQRSSGGDYSQTGGGGDVALDGGISTEDVGDSDLMAQPNRGPGRREYMDPVNPRTQDPGYDRQQDQADAIDQEDLWSTDVFDDLDGYNDRVPHHDSRVSPPTFTGRPHRQTEAALDDLDGMFDEPESATFRRRGL